MLEASGASPDRGSVVWRETFGHLASPTGEADRRHALRPGPVSKMVTTAAVMTLVDAGTVDLDVLIVRYVPDFRMASPEYRQITVRMLLSHRPAFPVPTTELRRHGPAPGSEAQIRRPATERLKTTPGAMSVYCNECFNSPRSSSPG
jgi:CubicO group peptidase (beta-lactamase class C family)